ncbi:DUF2851 family protein [Niabella drilacis]|uniref:DUF2851 domain-containing protein n=1 Tax=Niabella drilacis (strain DSM 25811 / CCM 8410 / CCUG 62505 / LMG 26954 / E90) TaxID=1285928 RepID=A0A1G6WTU0_NIADE|nr:DUF2851 family protein [Niabella drilacis]SDD68496.1 Protein of unknown function [Niabella drilacis]
MNEQLLQYIWQFQYFNTRSLATTEGIPVQVLNVGMLNRNQGPDFEHARIRIDNTLWAGSVELHLKTSDWNRHLHQYDRNYRKVILHVVYEDDDPAPGSLPVLELKTRVSGSLLSRYAELCNARSFIPCEKLIATVPEITLSVWKSRLVAERLIRKGGIVEDYLEANHRHWEESFWWLLAKNFGLPVNGDAFEAIARSIPLRLLAKHKLQIQQLEALLLGQGGLLNDIFEDPYPLLLQREYRFLQKKYNLQPVAHAVHFLRMRPGSFPTVRLAQLAAVIASATHLFSKIIQEESLEKVREWFKADANDFWHYHYTLTVQGTHRIKSIGASMIDNIVINTIAPLLFAYGNVYGQYTLKEKAIRWLEETKPEKNSITKGFECLGLSNRSAMDSQAFIELKTRYCDERRCLYCAAGNYLLKREK